MPTLTVYHTLLKPKKPRQARFLKKKSVRYLGAEETADDNEGKGGRKNLERERGVFAITNFLFFKIQNPLKLERQKEKREKRDGGWRSQGKKWFDAWGICSNHISPLEKFSVFLKRSAY